MQIWYSPGALKLKGEKILYHKKQQETFKRCTRLSLKLWPLPLIICSGHKLRIHIHSQPKKICNHLTLCLCVEGQCCETSYCLFFRRRLSSWSSSTLAPWQGAAQPVDDQLPVLHHHFLPSSASLSNHRHRHHLHHHHQTKRYRGTIWRGFDSQPAPWLQVYP